MRRRKVVNDADEVLLWSRTIVPQVGPVQFPHWAEIPAWGADARKFMHALAGHIPAPYGLPPRSIHFVGLKIDDEPGGHVEFIGRHYPPGQQDLMALSPML